MAAFLCAIVELLEGMFVTRRQHCRLDRLRTEVVESAQRSLEHTASLKAPAEQARAYQKQILLMIDQAVRMPTLHSTGGHGPGPLCPDTDLT